MGHKVAVVDPVVVPVKGRGDRKRAQVGDRKWETAGEVQGNQRLSRTVSFAAWTSGMFLSFACHC